MEQVLEFLNQAHSPYHVVQSLVKMLRQAGYKALREEDAWGLLGGGKYYIVRGGSSLIAFRIPEGTAEGFLMAACHDDFPGFAVKDNLDQVGAYTRLDTETYGGMIMSTWLDRPLGIAGRVWVRTQQGLREKLVDLQRDVALIPSVAIHLNSGVNEGFKWNPAVDLQPLLGGKEAKGKLRKLLEAEVGGPILSSDLKLYVRQSARVWGLEEEFLSGAGLDDLLCVWGCSQGFLKAKEGRHIPVLCVFDNEEVGSGTVQGADSDFLQRVLERICRSRGLDKSRMMGKSFMVSADNGHGLHPNHPELSDRENAPILNGGVVVKFHSNRRYTTDGLSAGIFRGICQNAGVPTQSFYNRADLRGGTTLGNISLRHVTVHTVDVGLAQLAMHSAYETAGAKDVDHLCRAMEAYYGCHLEMDAQGEVKIG